MSLFKFCFCIFMCSVYYNSTAQDKSSITVKTASALENIFSDRVVNQHNTMLLNDLLADNFISHHFPKPGNNTKTQFIEAMNSLISAFPDIRISRMDQYERGDKVFTYAFWEGTQTGSFNGIPATNKKVHVEYMDIWKVQNGKITENWVMMDILGLLIQLGVVPQPGQ